METSQFEDSCPDRQLLHEFNSGLLGDEKLRSLAAHIGECPRCEETVDRLAKLGMKSVVFDPCGNTPDKGDYLEVMRANVKAMEPVFASQP